MYYCDETFRTFFFEKPALRQSLKKVLFPRFVFLMECNLIPITIQYSLQSDESVEI